MSTWEAQRPNSCGSDQKEAQPGPGKKQLQWSDQEVHLNHNGKKEGRLSSRSVGKPPKRVRADHDPGHEERLQSVSCLWLRSVGNLRSGSHLLLLANQLPIYHLLGKHEMNHQTQIHRDKYWCETSHRTTSKGGCVKDPTEVATNSSVVPLRGVQLSFSGLIEPSAPPVISKIFQLCFN